MDKQFKLFIAFALLIIAIASLVTMNGVLTIVQRGR